MRHRKKILIKTRCDTEDLSKDINRPLQIGKNNEVVGMMKDELG